MPIVVAFRHHCRAILAGLAVLVLASLAAPPARAESGISVLDVCATHTATQERVNGIPPYLLTAISLVESGRWNEQRRARIAWPWTVNNGGVGKFFPTKAAAIAHVRALKARGETNIDVGCMQINLHYHADAFPTLEKALDPAANVAYAVQFLTRLHAETGSWTDAVKRYHSGTPVYAERYMTKFRVAWREAKENAVLADAVPVQEIRDRMAAIEAAYEAERARLKARHEVEMAVLAESLAHQGEASLSIYEQDRAQLIAKREADAEALRRSLARQGEMQLEAYEAERAHLKAKRDAELAALEQATTLQGHLSAEANAAERARDQAREEAERAAARAEAESWRAEKLRAYIARRQDARATADNGAS